MEYVPSSYINNVLIREGYLRTNLSNGFYWITGAAARFGPDRVLGKAFPK
jgi:hypothetical protein